MKKVEIGHGSGGKMTRELIENLFLKYLDFEELKSLEDASYLKVDPGKIAMTTDSYVVKPYKFLGGNVGRLSVSGTVNDLVVSGAVPKYMSLGFIIEEGFPISELEMVVKSVADTAKSAGVSVVTGDTKVVERGKADGIYINTTGIGFVKRELSPISIKPGDAVIVTGCMGDHGVAISLAREGFEVETQIPSDCAPLNSLIVPLFSMPGLRWMRDPTRGGLATVLIELSEMSNLGIELFEDKIPVRGGVKFVCDMLGYDPLYLANEGKAVIIVSKNDAEKVLDMLRSNPLGRDASIIGNISNDFKGVRLRTSIGGERRLEMLDEDPLPRIC